MVASVLLNHVTGALAILLQVTRYLVHQGLSFEQLLLRELFRLALLLRLSLESLGR